MINYLTAMACKLNVHANAQIDVAHDFVNEYTGIIEVLVDRMLNKYVSQYDDDWDGREIKLNMRIFITCTDLQMMKFPTCAKERPIHLEGARFQETLKKAGWFAPAGMFPASYKSCASRDDGYFTVVSKVAVNEEDVGMLLCISVSKL